MKKKTFLIIVSLPLIINIFYCFFRLKANKVFMLLSNEVTKENEILYLKYSNIYNFLSPFFIYTLLTLIIILTVFLFINKIKKLDIVKYIIIVDLLSFIVTIPFYFLISEGFYGSFINPLFIANLNIIPFIIIVLLVKTLIDKYNIKTKIKGEPHVRNKI